jgi:hypothetical protein
MPTAPGRGVPEATSLGSLPQERPQSWSCFVRQRCVTALVFGSYRMNSGESRFERHMDPTSTGSVTARCGRGTSRTADRMPGFLGHESHDERRGELSEHPATMQWTGASRGSAFHVKRGRRRQAQPDAKSPNRVRTWPSDQLMQLRYWRGRHPAGAHSVVPRQRHSAARHRQSWTDASSRSG